MHLETVVLNMRLDELLFQRHSCIFTSLQLQIRLLGTGVEGPAQRADLSDETGFGLIVLLDQSALFLHPVPPLFATDLPVPILRHSAN